MLNRLLDLLFPRVSLTGSDGAFVTGEEIGQMTSFPVRMDSEELRTMGLQSLDRIVAASTYNASPMLKTAVHRFKYGRVRAMGRPLGSMLAEAARYLPDHDDASVLCPVPLHWSRLFTRGFNQSELLAESVMEECGWEVRQLLRRRHATGHQAHRTHAERRTALRDVFVVRSLAAVPLHVVLVDDVATTGATLDACASALKDAGAHLVEALVLAKG